ncbi:NAD(P)H-dependent glycerol-3-phosphate dehydrogenase [Mycoplasmatota bacterium]|nr:NAD(P)H-dependent glycerol-3-phosphate dehydrogenase [Mycoplasmatota bacterium]
MRTITIIGAGSWGSGLSLLLADNKHLVKVYDLDQSLIAEINNHHTNERYLPGSKLPNSIIGYTDLKEALLGSDVVLTVVPTKVMRQALKSVNDSLDHPVVFVNASKGIEPKTFKRVSEIVYEEIAPEKIKGFVALTGPSHAEEVIKRQLTTVAASSDNIELAKDIQQLFNNDEYFRVYTLNDLIGAELGGSLKNIIALAAGILSGLGYGDNAKAALITRGLAEMRRLAVKAGAKEETLFGLTGLGDLIVTATSMHSRNYQAGLKIGSGKNLKETLASMTMVVEGVRSCEAAYKYAKELDVEMPIIFAVYDVLFNEIEPVEILKELMQRNLKSE